MKVTWGCDEEDVTHEVGVTHQASFANAFPMIAGFNFAMWQFQGGVAGVQTSQMTQK